MSKIDYSSFAFGKPNHSRGKEKRVKRSRFDAKTIESIFIRDNFSCVKCGDMSLLERIPHHVIFRSQMGQGVKRNGVTICIHCHAEAHHDAKVRRWFEEWVEQNLDENGDMKRG